MFDYKAVILVTKFTERQQIVFGRFVNPVVLINHVFAVKFGFAGKCFISFLDGIVNYVAWAATEIYRIINRLVF